MSGHSAQMEKREMRKRPFVKKKPHTEGGSSKYIKTDIREDTNTCGLNRLYLEGSVPVVSSRVTARW
jgi:hypothetical protein